MTIHIHFIIITNELCLIMSWWGALNIENIALGQFFLIFQIERMPFGDLLHGLDDRIELLNFIRKLYPFLLE